MAAEGEGNTGPQGNEGDGEQYTPEDAKKFRDRAYKMEGLAKNLEKEKDQLLALTKKFEGIDLDEFKQLKERAEEAERKAAENDPAKAAELQAKREKKFREEWDAKEKDYLSRTESLEKQLRTLTVTDKVMGGIRKIFNDDVEEFIRSAVERAAEKDSDGDIYFKDEKGEVLYSKKHPSVTMGIEEYGEHLASKYPSMAKAQGTSGGRDATSTSKAPPGARVRSVPETYAELAALGPQWKQVFAQMTPEQQAKIRKTMPIGGA